MFVSEGWWINFSYDLNVHEVLKLKFVIQAVCVCVCVCVGVGVGGISFLRLLSPAGGGSVRPPGAMCLPHTNNMDNKLQGTGSGGGASLRLQAGGVPLEPFIHQVGVNRMFLSQINFSI